MIDSEIEIPACIVDFLTAHGETVVIEDIAHLFGSTDVDQEWAHFLAHLGAGGGLTLAELRSEVDAVLPRRVDVLPLLPGVVAVLDAARAASWCTGIATGQERGRLDQHLARLDLLDRFDVIVTRGEVARGKPAPDIYLAAADRLGLAAGDLRDLDAP